MNIGDITVIISVLAGMVAVPFAASTVSVADDYKYGLATILNSTPEFAANASSTIPSLISKTVSDEGIKYIYRTPYGEFVILISPEKFEETLLKAGKKVSALQSSSEQVWELSMPSESLIINHNNQKIIETYRNLNGYLSITTENGWVSRNKSGTATEEELLAGMLRLESEMNETISLMKNMSGEILGITKVEISYLYCAGNSTTDYIELTNNKLGSISLAGWTVSDTVGSTSTHTFPSNFSMPAQSSIKMFNNITGITWNNNETESAILRNSAGEEISRRICDVS